MDIKDLGTIGEVRTNSLGITYIQGLGEYEDSNISLAQTKLNNGEIKTNEEWVAIAFPNGL